MRLDKYLCDLNIGSRSRVKQFISQGLVSVNDAIVKQCDFKIHENNDNIFFQGKQLGYQKYYYFMLNKPQGVVSATKDNKDKTVLDLLSKEDFRNDLFPVGRLDKDTEGLLLLTNNGSLAHELLSPRKHVDKTYQVILESALSPEAAKRLEEGVDIGETEPTLPAKVKFIENDRILLTIHEGRFHQVKRMLQAVGNKVIGLKRLSFGNLCLDEKLAPGAYRILTEREVELLHGRHS